ncbi:endolytic transglycosylase MltG [Megalodesulfovibrio gigas]|uniref:Endolytic murein transglycosylase n=1 Tax=Megalodesulfovibrio gigas (strain ATCC 19364 / DSM 1382 / NCIMB 9332 / VKM B-1759) TaxID=1121448 RepID=T2GBB6_MEGG1|nr:endolytic transglycosylase MltG [Megalodesulfovibrio gigas]AGW13197.1 putative aminodeoxychorismate lyase [Megalodesulfovibrio gigas DSM 1382 = ATCC 19364]
MRRILLSLAGIFLIVILGLTAAIYLKAQHFLRASPETPGRDVVFTVEQGQTFDQVARALEAEGVITSARYFIFLGKWEKRLGSVQAGDFQLSTGWPPAQVLETLATGKPILYRLSIREGLTWWETAQVIEDQGFANASEIKTLVHDPELLKKYRIPFENAEGFLFPETYLLKRPGRQDARFIVELLLKTFWDKTARIWAEHGEPDAAALARLVTLASLVERETGVPAERARVAGVYTKRLARNMLLQCDPTIIYGLGTAFDGNIRRSHINDAANLYNTYQRAGLPPGPICSPGLDALKAASDPEEHDYLYFVATGDGGHVFSKTLDEHNRAVRQYQLRR